MPGRETLCLGLTTLLLACGVARAQHGSGGHSAAGAGSARGFPGMPLGPLGGGQGPHGGHRHGGGSLPLAAVGGVPVYVWPYYVAGPGGYPGLIMGPGGFLTPVDVAPTPRGPLLPPPPPEAMKHDVQATTPATPNASDLSRANQLLSIGDRLFRAGNLKKAEERYLQAQRAASNQAAPHVRLAQVAVARGQYTEAANRLRDAETAQPGWLLTAPDIQAIYGEPAEFLRQVARLESFVHAHPEDRDAWLVLGAQWFLSGRTARASDVFLRLDDPRRKPDLALAAFLFASNHARPRAAADGEKGP